MAQAGRQYVVLDGTGQEAIATIHGDPDYVAPILGAALDGLRPTDTA
ncbi:hypothetical protein ABZT08_09465 [Streptomyces sp. NPDC005526]